jgi:hypothetical protein
VPPSLPNKSQEMTETRGSDRNAEFRILPPQPASAVSVRPRLRPPTVGKDVHALRHLPTTESERNSLRPRLGIRLAAALRANAACVEGVGDLAERRSMRAVTAAAISFLHSSKKLPLMAASFRKANCVMRPKRRNPVLHKDMPDQKPFKVYRVTWSGKRIECVAEYATEQEAFDHERQPNWHYAFYHGHKKI